MQTMVDAQMKVLNDSYSGETSARAADSPFRFDLAKTEFVVNESWYTVTPGKTERDMKSALYEGDATTLNVYTGNIGAGLLGWAYFPKGYNNGRDFIDGVVILDESMPGGVDPDDPSKPWKYGEGDTLTHEVGHWMMLEHTFAHGCGASGDWVADTPKEAQPQFDCPVGRRHLHGPRAGPDPQLHGLHAGLVHERVHARPGRADERRVDRRSGWGPRPDGRPTPTQDRMPAADCRGRHPASPGGTGGTLGGCCRCGSRCPRR